MGDAPAPSLRIPPKDTKSPRAGHHLGVSIGICAYKPKQI